MIDMKNKLLIFMLTVALLLPAFCFGAAAEDSYTEIPEGFFEAIDELPSESRDKLPDEIYSEDTSEVAAALSGLASPRYILDFFAEILGSGIGDMLKLLAKLCGVMVLSALCSALRRTVASEALSSAIGFAVGCAILGCILEIIYSQIELLSAFFERLNSLMLTMIPVLGTLYAAGGNITGAVASGSSMYLFLAISENFCARTIVPIVSVCTALALCRAISPSMELQSVGNAIKRCYTFSLGLIMSLLLFLLAGESTLTAAADSMGSRAAKVLASSMIPVVGGSISETLRTAAAGVQYAKSIVGVGGVVFILLLLLPTLISLLLGKLAFMVGGALAGVLGCEDEVRLLTDIGGIYNCMIAVVSMCSVMFIFAINIFIKTAVAIG